jgi:hypothetical protein
VNTPQKKFLLAAIAMVLLLSSALTGCSKSASAQSDLSGLAMASMDNMPEGVKSAPVSVQQAYQFAVANPGITKQIPCYCGCSAMGHTSNYSCYVTSADASGKITYDEHALGCSICVDITQDVMRLMKENKPIEVIRAYVDTAYAKYGPSNMSGAGTPSVSPAGASTGPTNTPICKLDNSKTSRNELYKVISS